ncbi:hypothetical protein [Arthrobacter sp. ok909]|uniref:hypothetical protein n=1 Tax=Arthrobacter sp. ok909 TaxID=1761746 RepID=UPI001113AA4F|nr:hypothetical protein [Arthrobacter sp. ok909]
MPSYNGQPPDSEIPSGRETTELITPLRSSTQPPWWKRWSKALRWKRHGSAIIAALAAITGSLVGALIAGNYASNAVQTQIQAQAAKDKTAKEGDVYSRFLVAVEQYRSVHDLPPGVPPRDQADESLQRADVDLYLYGSDDILKAGVDLENILEWRTNPKSPTERLDGAAYSKAYAHFVDVFKQDLHRQG